MNQGAAFCCKILRGRLSKTMLNYKEHSLNERLLIFHVVPVVDFFFPSFLVALSDAVLV